MGCGCPTLTAHILLKGLTTEIFVTNSGNFNSVYRWLMREHLHSNCGKIEVRKIIAVTGLKVFYALT